MKNIFNSIRAANCRFIANFSARIDSAQQIYVCTYARVSEMQSKLHPKFLACNLFTSIIPSLYKHAAVRSSMKFWLKLSSHNRITFVRTPSMISRECTHFYNILFHENNRKFGPRLNRSHPNFAEIYFFFLSFISPEENLRKL